MSSVLGINKDNLTFKFCDNNLVRMEFDGAHGKKVKNITFDQFIEAVLNSKDTVKTKDKTEQHSEELKSSDIYPNGQGLHVVQIKDNGIGKKVIVLKRDAIPFNITYYKDEYKNCGLPILLFGIVIVGNKLRTLYVTAIKNYLVTNKTELFQYPFSNVNKYNGRVCLGTNNVLSYDIDTLFKTRSIPNIFLSMPNNDDGYNAAGISNNSHMQQRQLLKVLEGKEFNNDWLVSKNGTTYAEWFNLID